MLQSELDRSSSKLAVGHADLLGQGGDLCSPSTRHFEVKSDAGVVGIERSHSWTIAQLSGEMVDGLSPGHNPRFSTLEAVTVASVELDPEVFADLALPCHVSIHGTDSFCERDAAWAVEVVCRGCGRRSGYVCDSCSNHIRRHMDEAARSRSAGRELGHSVPIWCRSDKQPIVEFLSLTPL